MPFLPPNQQRQSTEGLTGKLTGKISCQGKLSIAATYFNFIKLRQLYTAILKESFCLLSHFLQRFAVTVRVYW